MVITDQQVREAFDHMQTFSYLHFHKQPHEQFEALATFEQFLGMTPEAMVELSKRADAFIPGELHRAKGWIIIGFLLGLTAAERSQSV